MCVSAHTHTHTHTHIYIYSIYIYIHTFTHTHAYIYIHTHPHTHIYIYIYILTRRHNLKPKFAQVPEQSDFTHCVYLVAAEHVQEITRMNVAASATATGVHETPSLAARYLEKKTRRCFDFFRAPFLPVSPVLPEVDPTIDKNKRSG